METTGIEPAMRGVLADINVGKPPDPTPPANLQGADLDRVFSVAVET
jgi:hypothetical protein